MLDARLAGSRRCQIPVCEPRHSWVKHRAGIIAALRLSRAAGEVDQA
jgi:hypothetical protein